MSQSSDDPDSARTHAEEILHDHERVRGLLSNLDELLAQAASYDAWLDALHAALEAVARVLPEHFQLEQTGELYRTLPLERPEFARRIGRLEDEHPTILRLLDEARRRAVALRASKDGDLAVLAGQVRELVATLRAHEGAENELIAEIYYDELGGPG